MFHLHLGQGLVVWPMISLLALNSWARRRRVSVEVPLVVDAGPISEIHSAQVMSVCHSTLHEKHVLLLHEAHFTMGCSCPPSWICPLPQPAAHLKGIRGQRRLHEQDLWQVLVPIQTRCLPAWCGASTSRRTVGRFWRLSNGELPHTTACRCIRGKGRQSRIQPRHVCE